MSNYENNIYRKLSGILTVMLIINIIYEIYRRFIGGILFGYLYNTLRYSLSLVSLISIALAVVMEIGEMIVFIILIRTLNRLFRASGDSSVYSARNFFIGILIGGVINLIISRFGGFVFSFNLAIYFIVVVYLPGLILTTLYLLAWINLSKYFKRSLPSSRGKTGATLIIVSFIPNVASGVIYIIVTLIFGPIYYMMPTQFLTLLETGLGGLGIIGLIIEIIGYVLLIGDLKKSPALEPTISMVLPNSVEKSYFSNPAEPTLNSLRFCTQCGAQNELGAKFCNRCGDSM